MTEIPVRIVAARAFREVTGKACIGPADDFGQNVLAARKVLVRCLMRDPQPARDVAQAQRVKAALCNDRQCFLYASFTQIVRLGVFCRHPDAASCLPSRWLIIRLRASRGKGSNEASRNFARNPGRTVVRWPSASSVARATIAGLAAAPMRMSARASNPAANRPGAEAIDIDTGTRQFKPQPFRESLDERLGRGIGRGTRDALKRQQGTHQYQPATPLNGKPSAQSGAQAPRPRGNSHRSCPVRDRSGLSMNGPDVPKPAMAASRPTSISSAARAIASTAPRCPTSTATTHHPDAWCVCASSAARASSASRRRATITQIEAGLGKANRDARVRYRPTLRSRRPTVHTCERKFRDRAAPPEWTAGGNAAR